MKYEINVQQVDEAGEYVDGFEMRLRITTEALTRVLPGLLAESMGAEQVAVTTVMPTAAANGAPTTKRPRRTKAEMEAAAKAEAEVAQQQAAPAAPVPGGPAPQSTAAAGGESLDQPATAGTTAPYDPFAGR